MTAYRVSTFGYFYLGGDWGQGADLGILARIWLEGHRSSGMSLNAA